MGHTSRRQLLTATSSMLINPSSTMQLMLTLCYILIAIRITPSCGHPVNQLQQITNGKTQIDRRMAKRDASILIDNFPVDTMDKPKVVYRRLSKHIYRAPKPKYGQGRPKHGSQKVTRNPLHNKYKYKKVNAKFPPVNKKRAPKPRYTPPPVPFVKRKPNKNRYRPRPKPENQSFLNHHQSLQEPAGFGEPPSPNFQAPNTGYGEPPVDSYGAPLDTKLQEPYPNPGDFGNNIENSDKNVGQDYILPDLTQPDNNYGYSQTYQRFVKPNLNVFNYEYDNEEHNPNSYSDIYAGIKTQYEPSLKKKPNFNGDVYKLINRPWIAVRPKQKHLVGGQYAEPPARYIAKLQPSGPVAYDDEDNFNPQDGFVDPDSPVTVSPYVNYKNSNMAFSPQNLNDAFSIVDKRR